MKDASKNEIIIRTIYQAPYNQFFKTVRPVYKMRNQFHQVEQPVVKIFRGEFRFKKTIPQSRPEPD